VSNNELKYTSLTNEDILAQVYDRFLKTPNGDTNHKFDNFRESAIAQTLIEIFAGTVDINNYYIQRRAEECYFDTAQLKSSVISLSRMFGYVMNRKEPSRAKLRMVIEGDIEDNQIQIPYYSKFSYGGDPYVLVNTMTYNIPTDEYNEMNKDSVITIDADSFGNPIQIVQGNIKEKVFNGATNTQVNAPFQIYKIEDKDFSNLYGDKDFFYNGVTQIYVGENKIASDDGSNTQFSIDRRSLLNWKTIDTSDLSKSQNICVVRTSPDGFVEILFGDGTPGDINTVNNSDATGGFARKGAMSRKDNIYVQYLACEGKSTNTTGVISDKVDFAGKIFNSNGFDISTKVSFELLSNVYGGSDEESMDSIKYSSPKIYNSLDRLVTKDDYVAYMKSLNSPINVQNAIAWGEQEERDLALKFALAKMFNVTLFTMTGSMYDLDAQPHGPKIGEQYDDVVLDLDYDPYAFQTQGYFNIFIIQEMVNQLKRYSTLTTFKELYGNNFYTSSVKSDYDQLQAISEHLRSNIFTSYPTGQAKLTFKYTSDDHANTSNIESYGSVVVKGLDTLYKSEVSGRNYLEKLAGLINTAMVEFKDVRGNRTDNKNYNREAFIGRWANQEVVVWDTVDDNNKGYDDNSIDDTEQLTNGSVYKFRFRFNESAEENEQGVSPCYITSFPSDDDSNNATAFGSLLGLNGFGVFNVSENSQTNQMNGKITQVVNDLSSRSQTNIENIYVSPIIHRFNLVGDIFVKSLYDKEAVRSEITDELYKWLDINADFNQPLYLSNIVEICENHLGVIHTNIRLEPEDITAGIDNTKNAWYDPSYDSNAIYKKYDVVNKDDDGYDITTHPISEHINKSLNEYIAPKSSNSTANDDWYRQFMASDYVKSSSGGRQSYDRLPTPTGPYSVGSTGPILEEYDYSLLNDISERSFYAVAGELYTYFKGLSKRQHSTSDKTVIRVKNENGVYENQPNYGLFIGLSKNLSTDYRTDVVRESAIKSDFATILEDIHKDLSYIIMNNLLDSNGNIDAEYNNDGVYIRGGFSLGSEIVQVLTESTYDDAKKQPTKFLQLKYK